mgnify:FL=1
MFSGIPNLNRILNIANTIDARMNQHDALARKQNLRVTYRVEDWRVYIRDLDTFEGGDFNLTDFLLSNNPREFFETNF